MLEARCRPLSETLELAVAAGIRAGVTRVADVTAFAIPGIPVFQATRPDTRSLAVSQGKGLTPTAAIVGALLEAVELWAAERLPAPAARCPLGDLRREDIATWSGARDGLAIDLDRSEADLLACAPRPEFESGALDAADQPSGERVVDRRQPDLRGVPVPRADRCELRLAVVLEQFGDPLARRLIRRIERAGFELRAWSTGQEIGLAAIEVTMFGNGSSFDDIAPVTGNGCHPEARVALLRALLEGVQTRAALVAGGRDDLTASEYRAARECTAGLLLGAFAFGDGLLDWRDVPTAPCVGSAQALDVLLAAVQRATDVPVIAYDHEPPAPGLHLAHVLAPGLLDLTRTPAPRSPAADPSHRSVRRGRGTRARKILFAGPSIAGLEVPGDIELRPPAHCGDLAALLDDPPAVVGLIDGYFKIAPTVWHKEILSLLSLGTRVVGGASLGALRAAELERFGMAGVGAIFHGYRSGMLVRDDAVMLVHAPAELGYAPLSVPLVDAEHALLGAELPAAARRTMQRIVRRASFETRTWPACVAEYRRRTGEDFPATAEALAAAPSLKRIDALLVIEALAAEPQAEPEASPPGPPLTSHYRRLLSSTVPAFAAGPA